MKNFFLSSLLIILLNFVSKAQGKIDILINEETQQFTNEAKRIFNEEDKIEIRIYPDNQQQIKSVVNSLSTEGCGVKISEKDGSIIKIFRPKTEQQQQRSSTKLVQEKFVVTRTFKPVIQDKYVSFSFFVKDVTACKGKTFHLVTNFNSKTSSLNKYSGYRSKYKFYYVL